MQEILDVPPPQKNFNDSLAGEPISKDTAATRQRKTLTKTERRWTTVEKITLRNLSDIEEIRVSLWGIRRTHSQG